MIKQKHLEGLASRLQSRVSVDYPKGKVSSIILSSNLIASATSVTTVRLQNLGLADQIGTLAAFLPSSIESLDLTNTLLTSFPAELGSLRLLKDLYEKSAKQQYCEFYCCVRQVGEPVRTVPQTVHAISLP
uniref:Uncharacterized protein n=1 Tax=Hyaloperonospora arabidopsidis (strain Emoy2) TaxID=559515 RepID=M4BTX7_HYAAE